MLTDLVVDTNIWMHASDPREAKGEDALNFIVALVNASATLCVDEGFHEVEGLNRSRIWSEYLANVPEGTVGRQIIATMASSGRVAAVGVHSDAATSKIIRQLVHDRTDRVFVLVARQTQESVVVSHDLAAFPVNQRKDVRDRLGVMVVDASAAQVML